MAEKIRKKVYKPVAGADLKPETPEAPEIREEPAVPDTPLKPLGVSETVAAPYAEFGGLSESLAARRSQASRSREEALSGWQKALEEQKSARLALVNAAKPKSEDTAKEQRRLRNLAIGQAVGEFVGALFGGIQGLGSRSGRGYVPKMPGMYRNTLARLQQLRDNDILANEKYRNLMGSMLERNAGDRAAAAKARYDAAVKDGLAADAMQDKVALAAAQARAREILAEKEAEWRLKLEGGKDKARQALEKTKHGYRMEERGIYGGDVDYLTKLLLPKTRTSATSGTQWGRTETSTTVRDATSYSKQEVAAAMALARRIAPMVERYHLKDKEVLYLKRIAEKYNKSWEEIAELLDKVFDDEDKLSVGDISAYLAEEGME